MPEKPPTDDFAVDVLVEQPGGTCNRYVYDDGARAVRLAEVLSPGASFPADRGIVPATLTPSGDPLAVVLLVTHHIFPGVRVTCRPLALVEAEDGSAEAIVAVPSVDPFFARRRDVGDITERERQAIEALYPRTRLRWQDASSAVAMVRLARERAAWARVEAEKGQRLGRSWQADRLVGSGRVSDVHTPAERDLRALPFRFQRYVADCLFPDERILLFVTRPSMPTTASVVSFWRPRRLPEGLLVITDRQVLWMVDAMPPDATMVQWGYVAQVGALERVSSVAIDQREDHLCLTITLAARRGTEGLAITFPTDRRGLLVDATKLIERFIPGPPTRAVRRIYSLVPEALPSYASGRRDDAEADPNRERLRELALKDLGAEEVPAAVAYVPAGHRRPAARLLLATNHRVIVVRDRPETAVASFSIADLTSMTLRNALVSCLFELTCPTDGGLERLSIPFDYPQRDAMLDLFSAVRQMFGQPFGVIPLVQGQTGRKR